jgi:hypothetical protein
LDIVQALFEQLRKTFTHKLTGLEFTRGNKSPVIS